jgi:hypothetical protein
VLLFSAGANEELPGGMELCRQVRPSRMDRPEYKELKKRIKRLQKQSDGGHAEIYRLLSELINWEMRNEKGAHAEISLHCCCK